MEIQYIVIAGSIGSGKTTLCETIQRISNANVLREEPSEALNCFYSNPGKYSFLNQLSYSVQFLRQATKIAKMSGFVVQDRSIHECHDVFSRMLTKQGFINNFEFSLLEEIYKIAVEMVRPTKLVYLETTVESAMSRIKSRNSVGDHLITLEYLRELKMAYFKWYKSYDISEKVTIDTTALSSEEVAQLVAEFAGLK